MNKQLEGHTAAAVAWENWRVIDGLSVFFKFHSTGLTPNDYLCAPASKLRLSLYLHITFSEAGFFDL